MQTAAESASKTPRTADGSSVSSRRIRGRNAINRRASTSSLCAATNGWRHIGTRQKSIDGNASTASKIAATTGSSAPRFTAVRQRPTTGGRPGSRPAAEAFASHLGDRPTTRGWTSPGRTAAVTPRVASSAADAGSRTTTTARPSRQRSREERNTSGRARVDPDADHRDVAPECDRARPNSGSSRPTRPMSRPNRPGPPMTTPRWRRSAGRAPRMPTDRAPWRTAVSAGVAEDPQSRDQVPAVGGAQRGFPRRPRSDSRSHRRSGSAGTSADPRSAPSSWAEKDRVRADLLDQLKAHCLEALPPVIERRVPSREKRGFDLVTLHGGGEMDQAQPDGVATCRQVCQVQRKLGRCRGLDHESLRRRSQLRVRIPMPRAAGRVPALRSFLGRCGLSAPRC